MHHAAHTISIVVAAIGSLGSLGVAAWYGRHAPAQAMEDIMRVFFRI